MNDTKNITNASNLGILFSIRSELQLNVDWHTQSITPTNVAIGIFASNGAPKTIPSAKNKDTLIPDNRLNPPPD